MFAPIAALIVVTSMALSLSVEADSFFHTPSKAATDSNAAETTADGAAGTGVADDSAAVTHPQSPARAR